MKHALVGIAAAALCCSLASANPNKDGKTMAVDDWHSLSIYGVGADQSAVPYLQVRAGDLDGDGKPDDAVVKLDCAGGVLKQAHYTIVSPRDAATGQASGKRTHKPIGVVKEWGAATPQLMAMKTVYDTKKVEGARLSAGGAGWTAISLAKTDGLCAAASAVINTSRSNVKSQ